MRKTLQRGAGNLDGIVIIFVIIFILILTSGSGDGIPVGWRVERLSTPSSSGTSIVSGAYEISLGSGNAPYAYQSYEEYITIENRGRASVNITGWQLRNGKDKRPYNVGGSLQRFSADLAVIPQAALVLSPTGGSIMQDLILGGGEKAIITTGSVGVRTPYVITSFKENICTGYIDALPEYAFTPSLSRNCPRPANEPGLEALDNECRDFVKRLSACETPKFGSYIGEVEYCEDCINDKRLTSSCAAFVREHFSYQGCLAYHRGNEDFSGKTWRVFLGRGWEMWARDYESIELFDRNGELAGFRNY
jgi:hypothetical protein